MRQTEIDFLEYYNVCEEAMPYCLLKPDLRTAWTDCQRGDWMLWLAKRTYCDIRKVMLTNGKCLELIIPILTDKTQIAAINAAISFGKFEINSWKLTEAFELSGHLFYMKTFLTYGNSANYAANMAASHAGIKELNDEAVERNDFRDKFYASLNARKSTLLQCADI